MLSYELVKTVHLLAGFMLVGFAVVSLMHKSTRGIMIGYGVGGILSFLAGGLLIGILRQGMPGWMHAKILIWLAIMATVGIVNKRFPQYKTHAVFVVYGLVACAIYLAVYKPF